MFGGGSESEQHSGVLEAIPVYLGGTGAKTAAEARVNLGIIPANIGAIASSEKGANNGIAELDENGKVPSSQLPSYVDDVLEYSAKANFPSTGETGKIYVDTSTNLTYRWSGTAYVEISASLALGTTSSTAFRGDYGNAAYTHAVTNKGAAFSSGLYKITTNSEGHVTAATAVAKADITGLGIPASDTNTHRPIQVNGTEILGNNTTALNLKAGSNVTLTNSNGTVTVAATDTTYSSKAAASGGTAVSLVTTGEKYTWNNKSNLAIGTTATTAAAGNHTHTLSLATNSGTSKISLAANTKYQLTAGGSTYIFTTPPDTNTTYSAGTGLSLSSNKFSLATSGVTAGSYGPSADASPAFGGTFKVPYVTVDTYGRVTAASTKTITLPSRKVVSGVIYAQYYNNDWATEQITYSGFSTIPSIIVSSAGSVNGTPLIATVFGSPTKTKATVAVYSPNGKIQQGVGYYVSWVAVET